MVVARPIFRCVILVVLAVAVACGSALSGTPQTVRVLVVRATWGPEPQADFQAMTQAARRFIERASLGTVDLSFTETPWLAAYREGSECADVQQLIDEGAAAAASYSPGDYDRIVYLTPCRSGGEGSPITRTVVLGQPGLSATLLEHELGHTFGMSHAGALECSRARCALDPYGNPLDVMGTGLGDPGALQKAEAGWPVNVKTASVPGTYKLAAIEEPSALAQALVVHRGNVDLWIEHRDAVGNDAYLKNSIWRRVIAGVLVHEAPSNSPGIPFAQRRPDFLVGSGAANGAVHLDGKDLHNPTRDGDRFAQARRDHSHRPTAKPPLKGQAG